MGMSILSGEQAGVGVGGKLSENPERTHWVPERLRFARAMMGIARVMFYGLLLTFVLSVGLAYAIFPFLVKYVVENSLPDSIQLSELTLARPGLSQLRIGSLALAQLEPNANLIEVDQLQIDYSLFPPRLKQISVGRISAQLTSIESNNEQSASEESVRQAMSLPGWLPTQLVVERFDVDLTLPELPYLRVEGDAALNQNNIHASLRVSAQDKFVLNAQVKSSDWQTFTSHIQFSDLNLGMLDRMERFIEQPVTALSGRVSMEAMVAFGFDNALLAPDRQNGADLELRAFGGNALSIDSLAAQLSFKSISFGMDDVLFSDMSGTLNIEKKRHWRVHDSQLNGTAEVAQLQLPLVQTSFPFHVYCKALEIREDVAYADMALKLDTNQAFDLLSEIPLDMRQPSSHQVSFSLRGLDQSVSPLFGPVSVESVHGRAHFQLVKNAQWFIQALRTEALTATKIRFNQQQHVQAPVLETQIKWRDRFALGDDPFEFAQFIIKGLLFEDSALKLSAYHDIFGEVSRTTQGYRYEAELRPSALHDKVSTLAIAGAVKGEIVPEQALTFQTSLNVHVDDPVKLLMPLMPESRQLLQVVKINEDKSLDVTIALNGKQDLSQPAMPYVQGSMRSSDNRLTIATSTVSPLSVQLIWPELMPWSDFEFKAEAQIDYLGIDTQRHALKTHIRLMPELSISDSVLESSLLHGSLLASTPKEFVSLNQLKGRVFLKKISLKSISTIMENPNLSMSGDVSGEVPFEIRDKFPYFQDGEIRSDNGIIEYVPEGKKIVLTKENVSNIANIALQNFHYTVMGARLVSAGPCDMTFHIRLEGKNPDLGNQQSQVFNVSYNPASNVNLFYLLLLGEENIRQLDLKQLYSGCVTTH